MRLPPLRPTPSTPAGSDGANHPARAAIAGLKPNTTYDFRLVASNNSSSPAPSTGTFTTTEGFGFLLPGTNGFSAAVVKDGGVPASVVGTHPYQIDLGLGFKAGGNSRDSPA